MSEYRVTQQPRGPRPESFHVVAHGDPLGSIDPALPEVFDDWCSTLGPTTTAIWQYLARLLRQGPTFEMSVDDLAVWTGAAVPVVWKSLDRLVIFGRAVWLCDDTITVCVSAREARPRRAAS